MDLNEPGCASNGKLKTTSSVGRSSKSTGPKSRATTTSHKSTGETSPALTLSAEDSHASRFPLPGGEQARQMTVTSGMRWSAALTLSGPLGLLARMCLESSIWHSTRCVLIWNVSATPSGRSVYRLVPSMPRTNGNGSGFWPTPNARDYKDSGPNVNYEKIKKKCKLAGAVGGPVNPAFSEWLMGYPIGHTELKR